MTTRARGRVPAILAAAVGAVVALAVFGRPGGAASQVPPAGDRPAAPGATFDVFQSAGAGRTELVRTSLRSLRGRVVVLAFTDDRCAGCQEVRALGQIGNTIGQSTGFAVATGLSRSAAKKMVRTRQGRYIQFFPTAADPHGALARKYGVTSLPTILVIDREGRIAARFEQPPTPRALQDVLDALQPEPIPSGVDPPTRPHLSVFDTPEGAVRSLPAHLRPTTAPCPFVRDSVRQIGRAGDTRGLIARTLDGGLLLATAEPNGGGGTGCGTTASIPSLRARELARITHRGIVTALGTSGPGHSPLYALVVLDGYTTAEVNGTAFPVRRNGVVITGAGIATYVTLSGPAGTRHVKIFG